MGARRKGRESALQCLYQLGYARLDDPRLLPEEIERFFQHADRADMGAKARAYAETLVRGVCAHREEIDRMLGDQLKTWSLDRLTHIDRALLEMAVFEAAFADVPREVAINEAIEIAKRFSSEESAGFINGTLDAVIGRAAQKRREAEA